jgi:hypothetical protein
MSVQVLGDMIVTECIMSPACEDRVFLTLVCVKEYVNYVNIPKYGLDCLSRRSKSCVGNDGLSTED